MPWDSKLCATFYVVAKPAHEPPPDPLDLLGVTDLDAGSETAAAGWAGLRVEVRDRDLDVLRSLTLAFVEPVVPRRRRADARWAFWARITEAFRTACGSIRPVAAFVTDVAEPDVDRVVAGREQWVTAANPVPLLHEGFALLYLSRDWFPDLDACLDGLPHERIAVSAPGIILVGMETGGPI